MPNRPTAPAVDSAVRILQLMVSQPYPLTQRDISLQTGIPAASCYRIINSLLAAGLVSYDPMRSRAFCVGHRIFQMASCLYSRQRVLPFFYPVAEILRNETLQPVMLSSQLGADVVIVAKTAPPGREGGFQIGQAQRMRDAAAGIAMISCLAASQWRLYLASSPTVEDGKVNDDDWQSVLQRAAKLGYAVRASHDGMEGVCIAAPVLDMMHQPVAAISLCLPATLREEQVRAYSAPLIQAARQLSSRLG